MTKWIDKMRQRREERDTASAEQARAERKIEVDRQLRRKQEDLDRFHQKEQERKRYEEKQKMLAEEQARMDRERNK